MTELEKAKDWYRLLELKINAAKGIDDAKTVLLANKLLDKYTHQWMAWQPLAAELRRLQDVKKSVDLLRNPNSEKSWPDARNKLADAWVGADFPWPQLKQGLLPFTADKAAFNSQQAVAAPKQASSPAKNSGKTAPAQPISMPLPPNPQNIWLAIGDETGDWDYGSATKSRRGLVLILGRLDVWRRVFNEPIAGQTVAGRMGQPLRHLPPDASKTHFHHAMDAFRLGANNLPPDLINELQHNLGWLAQHRELITFGFSATYAELYQNFTHSQDASTALAKGYAALLAYVLPFLDKQDALLLGFEGRSENAGNIAATRSDFPESVNRNDRSDMDMRGFLSVLRDTLMGDLKRTWPDNGQWEDRFDLALLTKILDHPALRLSQPSKNAWKGLADLGPSLLRVRQDKDWSALFQFSPTPNVHFLTLSELSK